MEQDRYFVTPAGDQWAVKLNRQTLGTFPQRGQALEAAIVVAQRSGQHGIAAQVLSEAPDGDVQPIWTFGLDTYCKA